MTQDEFNAAVNRDIAGLIERESPEWQERVRLKRLRSVCARVNAGMPEIRTSSDDPHYWAEKYDEIRDDIRSGNEQ